MNRAVGPGWRPLVDEAAERLKALNVNVTGCHEKYGALRLEVDAEPWEAAVILAEIEGRSEHICEFCGLAGAETELDGWVKTLCPRCASAWVRTGAARG